MITNCSNIIYSIRGGDDDGGAVLKIMAEDRLWDIKAKQGCDKQCNPQGDGVQEEFRVDQKRQCYDVCVSFDTIRASASLPLKPKKTPTIYQINATQYMKLPINMDIQFSFKMSGKKNSWITYKMRYTGINALQWTSNAYAHSTCCATAYVLAFWIKNLLAMYLLQCKYRNVVRHTMLLLPCECRYDRSKQKKIYAKHG